jgi:serine/threonine protein kinase
VPACERCGATHPSATPVCAACARQLVLEHPVHDAEAEQPSPPSTGTVGSTLESTTTLPNANAFAPDLIGKTLLGQFDVLRKLGQGEFGTVYLAEQRGIDRPAVIKVLHRGLAANPNAVKRFQREAKALARLDHHHLVKLYNFGKLEDGTPFLAMEYGGDRTLADVLREQGSLPPARVRHLGEQVCEALAEAHARGVVHRDLKPANLLVSEKDGADWVKVVDVGIAKLLQAPGGDTDVSTLTREGAIIGTPAYFSPEQARGQLELDGRSDLYSLGVVLYEAVTGKRPFRGASLLDLVRAHALEKPAPLKAHGVEAPALEAVILRAMEKEPERRFATALEMREAIRTADRSRSRRRWPIVMAVGLMALAVFAFLRMPRPAPVRPPASANAGLARPQGPVIGEIPPHGPNREGAAAPVVEEHPPDTIRPPPRPATLKPEAPTRTATTVGQPAERAPPLRAGGAATEAAPTRGRRFDKKVAKDENPTTILRCTEVVDSRPVPPAESGEGILVILAIPWAHVTIDGNPIGEAPCELRIASGTFRMRLTHPELGEKYSTVEVAAGKRQVLQVSLGE